MTEPKIDKMWWMELWNRILDYFMYDPVGEDDLFKNMRWYRNENMTLTQKDR